MLESGKADPAAAKPSVAKNGANGTTANAPAPAPNGHQPTKAAPTAPELGDESGETPEGTAQEGSDASTTARTSEPSSTSLDAETTKRLATINAAEKRSRDKLAAERKELEARTKELEPQLRELEAFKALKAKARKGGAHLAAALKEGLGLTDDDFEPAAQSLYSLSKAGASDPNNAARKAAADRLLAEREQMTELEALRSEIRELKDGLGKEREQQTFEQQRTAYVEHAAKELDAAVGKLGDTRLARAMKGKNPAAVRQRLWAATVELTEANDGEVPEFADVVAHYQSIRRAELEELGVDPDAAIEAAPAETDTPKKNNQAADKKNPARTLSNDLSTPRVPRPAMSGDDNRKAHRKESLRMLESGKFE